MSARALLAAALLFPLTAAASAPSLISASDPNLKYYGRWDRRSPDRPLTVNSGSHIVGRFRATRLTARFDTSLNRAPFPTLCWRIDDGEWQEAELASEVELAREMRRVPHTLTLMVRDLDEHQSRWSAPLTASVTFLGLDPGGGEIMPPPDEPKLKLEFLGDSITEGVLVWGPRPGKETWPWRGDGRLAYSAQTAMRLGAQWRQVGFGRLGITIEGNGGVPPSPESFNFFHDGCPRDGWQPDAVIVNQGTNDGGRPAEVFRPGYARYLRTIREAYPKATIFAMRPFIGSHADDILSEITNRAVEHDTNICYVDTTGWLGPADYTDGVHPNAAGGAKAANKLAEAIRKRLKR